MVALEILVGDNLLELFYLRQDGRQFLGILLQAGRHTHSDYVVSTHSSTLLNGEIARQAAIDIEFFIHLDRIKQDRNSHRSSQGFSKLALVQNISLTAYHICCNTYKRDRQFVERHKVGIAHRERVEEIDQVIARHQTIRE